MDSIVLFYVLVGVVMENKRTHMHVFCVQHAETLIWFHSGCSCYYEVNEQTGSLEVCAEILFINGTASTTSDYTVTISADNTSASAQCKRSAFSISNSLQLFCSILVSCIPVLIQ